jgi:hypothetical protein
MKEYAALVNLPLKGADDPSSESLKCLQKAFETQNSLQQEIVDPFTVYGVADVKEMSSKYMEFLKECMNYRIKTLEQVTPI